jgi:hypothetical protein
VVKDSFASEARPRKHGRLTRGDSGLAITDDLV